MIRKVLSLFLALTLLVWPQALSAQSVVDQEVAKGIKQAEDGDYDAAILTLDNAARRLATDPSKTRDLAQAYVYLGIAYVGKGHEAAAKAKFREALGQMKDISLSPEKFPPKVINIFEEAKQEAAKAPAAAPEKKKGGSKGLLIGLGVAAVGGGIAAAAGGGKSTPTTPADTRKTETFGPITLTEEQYAQDFRIVVTASGTLEATVTWSSQGGERPATLAIGLQDSEFNDVAGSNLTGNTTAVLTASVAPRAGTPSQEYHVVVYHRDSCNGCVANFTLTVKHP